MLSGPVALFSFIPSSSLSTPFSETSMLLIVLGFFFRLEIALGSSGLEKTLENCSLNRLAFSLGS